MIRSKRLAINLSDIFVLYILAWSVTPIMAAGTIYRVILILCTLGWILLNQGFIRSQKSNISIMLLLLVVFFAIQAISSNLRIGISRTINLIIYCIVALIGMYYCTKRYEEHRSILKWMMLLSIVIAIISIKTVLNNPQALRVATHDWENNTASYGAYDFVYMCVQIIPFLLFSLINYNRNMEKSWNILCLASMIVFGLLIIASGFTLANAIGLIAIVLCILQNKPSVGKTVFIILILVVILFTYKQLITLGFQFLLRITANSPTYMRKIRDLYAQFVLNEGSGSAYSVRLSHYASSWDAVIKYPIFGSVFFTGKQLGGGHSTFVDVLAYGGFFLALPFYWLIIKLPVNIISKFQGCEKGKKLELILLFCVVVIITGIFDTITYANAWVWYLFIPFLARTSEILQEQSGV